ncbi:MAG: hypothetical protein COV74_01330 [Candidatus Omnitrophica bacterium CG11_big_fil_rev_8_21_14_0_20_45_26]|uniref:Glucans biosynthesis glucosyltransferase H n=1 Tax=Candidatus Abzuiibacterium crystallinum TaxID=1974748 RepID=A0A2H0LRZ7_9BACT|nr:MAG: hypothetical protein COV74_01330 [Candidatus Omnitrophica bacterium CG11_big_fil_rev_8_21_14_0_20_45_26]PIW64812.1 MAG: hypothetical protein COW12_04740 [Candidatus Omnitrophica bacterium CG12_big_fil_rev_8_21_14_0_65_45_16]
MNRMRMAIFLFAVTGLTIGACALVASTVIVTHETALFSYLWVIGFGILFFNVAFLFVLSLSQLCLKVPILPERMVRRQPRVALVYPVRNEEHGLFERIDYSLSGNLLPGLDLWILSDSDSTFERDEKRLVTRLSAKYARRIHYRRRKLAFERKQGNLKEFITRHFEYPYIYVADADSMVPPGAILKLLRKAEHPQNQDIAIFQSFVKIAHAKTWYAHFERIGTSFAQRFNFTAYQALFGRSISFGHHQLVRASLLRRIKLPSGLLSHDNWDTVLLDQLGYRVAFCPDVSGFDETPSNFLEARRRARRWAQGTLQGWPLPFMRGVTLASRFLAFYGIYLYLADLVFFAWVLLGLFSHSAVSGELIHYEVDCVWLGLISNHVLTGVLVFSLAVIFCHKLTIVRSARDLKDYGYEVLFSTLVTLNNFIYAPLDLLGLPLRKLVWRPMRKDPFERVRLQEIIKHFWLGTVAGIWGFYFCTHETPYFIWQIVPILISLTFSIPLIYLTGKGMPDWVHQWI